MCSWCHAPCESFGQSFHRRSLSSTISVFFAKFSSASQVGGEMGKMGQAGQGAWQSGRLSGWWAEVAPHHTPRNYEYFNELLPQAAANQNISFDCTKVRAKNNSIPKIEKATKRERERKA